MRTRRANLNPEGEWRPSSGADNSMTNPLDYAIQMYRQGKWSTRTAAESSGLDRWQFMEVLMMRRVPFPYTVEMLDQDFLYARGRVGAHRQ